MAISLKTAGTWARNVSDPTGAITIPGSPAAGDRMFLFATWKTYNITVATPSGWTTIGVGFTDGATASGNGTGSVKVMAWYRDWVTGDTGPSLNWSAAPSEAHVVVQLWTKGAGDVWSGPQTVTGAMTNWTTSSQTFSASSSVDIASGAVVMGLVGIRDDSATMTRPTTGISNSAGTLTWNGNYVESPATHFSSTIGDDMSGDLGHRFVTTGGTGITLSMTGTISAAETGSGKWVIQELDATFGQTAYRYYEDGTETGSTAIDAQDTNITRDVTSDSNLQLRVRLQETAGVGGASTDDYQLQYELNASGVFIDTGLSTALNLCDSYSESNQIRTEQLYAGGDERIAQSFTGNGEVLRRATFFLNKVGSPTGILQAFVYAHSGVFGTSSVPTGSPLATSDPIDPASLTTSYALYNFNFSGITLTNGTKYVVVLSASGVVGDNSNKVQGGADSTSSTHAGNQATYTAGVWSINATQDVCFYVYTTTTGGPVLGYASASLTDGNATTNRLGAGSGSFVAGEISEDGLVDDFTHTASNYTEHLYSLTLVSSALANNDTLDFRVLRNGVTTGMTYTVTPRITASKSSNVTVTPTTTTLTLTTFAPTATASDHKTVTPTTASLSLTAFAPTVILGTVLTPSTASLSLVTFAPTVTASDHKLVTPSTASLSLGTFAPTVTATDHKSATPSTASLTLTGFAPTVATSNNQLVTPGVGSLALTGFAPSVIIGYQVTPTTASLTLTTFAPTISVSDNKSFTPSTGSLTLATFAATISVSDHKTVTPGTASLTLTGFAPTVTAGAGTTITPTTASLTLTSFAPSVITSDNKSATPNTANLTLTTFAPSVTATANQIVTPTTVSLTLASFAPSVTATNNVSLTPSTLALLMTAFAPTVTVSTSNTTITPATGSLTLTSFAPTIRTTMTARKYFIDTDGSIFWVISQELGIVEKV